MKPESIRREELMVAIYEAINAAQLPVGSISDILLRIQMEVDAAARNQLQNDLADYNAEKPEEPQE